MEQRIVIRISHSIVYFFVYNYRFIRIFLLHMCAIWWGLVTMQGQCEQLMLQFLRGFTFYSVSSSILLKVTWNPECSVILRAVGSDPKSFDSRSWYVHGFSLQYHATLCHANWHVTHVVTTWVLCRSGNPGRCTLLCLFRIMWYTRGRVTKVW